MIFAFLFLASLTGADFSRVRKIEVKADQIITVRTAVGVATIIQVPDRPTSLVVGDSESFKIEYLDQAITIKPLRSNAKSNLYIYTDWKRFNVQLVTGAEASADYVVYLKTPAKAPPPNDPIAWVDVALEAKGDDLNLSIKRLGRLKVEYLFIEFRLSGRKTSVDPAWFWLTQSSKSKPVHRLLLNKLSLDQDAPLEGLIQVRLKDISLKEDLNLEIRRKKNVVLKIPKEILWR